MKLKQRIALILLIVTVQIGSVFPATAWATSSYDDVVVAGGQAKVSFTPVQPNADRSYYCGSDRLETDISTNWYTDIFKNSAAWYSDRWTPGYDQSIVDSFEAIKDTGGWALVQHVSKAVHTEYSSLDLAEGDSTVYLMWSDNPTAQFANDSIGGSAQTPRLDMRGNWHLIAIAYRISGNTCEPMVVGRNYGTAPTYSLQTLAYDDSYTLDNGYVQFLPISINFNVSYPEGYAGDYPNEYAGDDIPLGFTPIPVTTLYTGTIDCGGVNPSAMIIEQGDNDGSAVLTPTTAGMADWSYSLTTGPYRAGIKCGEKWIYTPYVDPATIDRDWVCDTFSRPPYCS